MPTRKDKNIVFDDGEDGDREYSVAIIDDNDDDDANEDLSLKILEKALSWRDGNKHEIPIMWEDQDEETMVDEVVVEGEGEAEKSAEPTGETCSNLVMKKLIRGARYFDPPDGSWVTCYSCGEQGHITSKRRKPCFICGSLEHDAKQSSKGHNCYICNKGGHRAKHCPDKYKSGSKDALCLRCGGFGHDMILCKYEYSQEDLKDIQCYVCKSFGHLCCVEPNNSPSWSVSCYICGKLGHTGLEHVCYICNEGGHRGKDCPDKYKKYKSGSKGAVCLRCGDFGHDMILCKYEYSQEDLKDIQCYVCKCFGHLCCVEPDNSQSWAVSCYICGQLGHTGLTCSRHYDETNENDSGSPLCYKCGEAGHFKHDCPNSCGLRYPENTREEETFSRECANSSSRDSKRLCYECRGKGHFARECPNISQDKLDIYLTRNSHLMQCIDQLLS